MRELISQHDGLRDMMDHCEDLMDTLDAHPDGDPAPLTRELAKLRHAFAIHNKFEESLLKPVLLERDRFGTQRVDRMVSDHVEEHRLIGLRLSSPALEMLRDVVETLRAHLDAEERYLLSSQALRALDANDA
jgi:hypothetical protein